MQKKLFHLYLKVNLYSKLYTMTQKTKILTLSLVSVAGLAAFTAFASNNTSQLEFKGEVKQNINLELKQLNLMPDITQKNNGGAAGISWKIVWDTLTTVDPRANDAPNTVTKQGKFSFGGHGNITNAAESLILAGEENNLSANTSIVGASKKIIGNQGEGNTVLSSSDITFAGDNHIINSSAHTQVNWTGNIVFSSEDVAINTIGSMAVGKKIRINHPGSFIFNGTDTEVASNKAYTTKIMADKGMIINTNSQKAAGVDLTINGGLKVAHNTTDGVWAIISQEKCLKIKGVNKWEIWFWCSTTPETQISTPKCGKNAADYPATANAWKESSDKGFCENGTLSPSTRPTFWTDAEKAAAKSNGSYASAGFGNYSFTICFVEGDPFCKASGAKKTWRCTTQEGNAMTCEATIAAEAKKCKANEHLEGTTCVANTKQVACDNTNIISANGTVSNNQVTITRSNGRWSAPEKCTLNCNAGYEKKTDPITHRESCEKKSGQPTFPKYRSCKPTKVPPIMWLRCDGNNCPVYKKWSRWEWREILNYALLWTEPHLRSHTVQNLGKTQLGFGEAHWLPVAEERCLRTLGECVPVARGDFPSDPVEYTITNTYNGNSSKIIVDHWERYIEILGLIKHNSDGTKSLTPEGEQFSAMNMTNSSSSLCYTTNGYCHDKAIGSECK